jgi:hypothetical protein
MVTCSADLAQGQSRDRQVSRDRRKNLEAPGVSGNRLFVRNGEEAACYDLGALPVSVA